MFTICKSAHSQVQIQLYCCVWLVLQRHNNNITLAGSLTSSSHFTDRQIYEGEMCGSCCFTIACSERADFEYPTLCACDRTDCPRACPDVHDIGHLEPRDPEVCAFPNWLREDSCTLSIGSVSKAVFVIPACLYSTSQDALLPPVHRLHCSIKVLKRQLEYICQPPRPVSMRVVTLSVQAHSEICSPRTLSYITARSPPSTARYTRSISELTSKLLVKLFCSFVARSLSHLRAKLGCYICIICQWSIL